MSTCGHSLWAVPSNYAELARKYNMKHIPHVSIERGLPSISHSPLLFTKCRITYKNGLSRVVRPDVECAAYYCSIDRIKENGLYLPVWFNYDGGYFDYLQAPEPVDALFLRADTASDDPSEWFLE